MNDDKCYVLIKQGYYWRENAAGYTGSLLEAGRYTSEEADKYVYPKGEISMSKIPACDRVTKHHLSEFSEGRAMLEQEQELATLRAKAEAYDKGVEVYEIRITQLRYGSWLVLSAKSEPQAIQDIIRHVNGVCDDQWMRAWEKLQEKGYTCRKVKVCEVVG